MRTALSGSRSLDCQREPLELIEASKVLLKPVGVTGKKSLLLLFRRAWFGSFRSRSICGRGFGRRHRLDGGGLTQWLDLNILFVSSVGPNYFASKDQTTFFDGDKLPIKKCFAWIDDVREFDGSCLNHRRPSAG